MNGRTYRSSHTAPGYGQRYNRNYAVGYYAALHREVETPIIRDLFASLSNGRRTLLDFACGTGRITQLAPPYFDRVVGVDLSPEMLKCAVPDERITYRLQDIGEQPLGERFGVVTAFRFFLNAEEELRSKALQAIREHLAPDGRLICNIHMNAASPLGAFYRLARRVRGLPKHNTLSLEQFSATLARSGFRVEQVIWYGVVPRPGRYFAKTLDRWLGPMERFLGRAGLRGRAAQSFIVVARLDQDAGTGGSR